MVASNKEELLPRATLSFILLTLSFLDIMHLSTYFFRLPRLSVLLLTSCLLLTVALSGCQKKEDTVTPTPTLTPPAVQLASDAKLGSFLTDGQGNTLYYFTLDVAGSNSCGAAACAAQWPVFYTPTITVGTGLNAADFTTGKTAGGQNQTLYKGWPLYYYAAPAGNQNVREQSGETLGNGSGSVWYVVHPDYTVMVAYASITNQDTHKVSTKSYLIDPQGRTLYTFSEDAAHPAAQPTNCTGGCIDAWPIFYQANMKAPSCLKASDFGTITRTDGPNGSKRLQTTYKGMPLYYFIADNAVRGKVEGEEGEWAVAMP
ncbi:MAG: COG4315 family predicted lipoprotein [Janthinobacterium lividum]